MTGLDQGGLDYCPDAYTHVDMGNHEQAPGWFLTVCGQVLVYSPSNTPIASPPDFLQQLPVHLDCEELGVHGLLRCPTPTGNQDSNQ